MFITPKQTKKKKKKKTRKKKKKILDLSNERCTIANDKRRNERQIERKNLEGGELMRRPPIALRSGYILIFTSSHVLVAFN